MNNMVVTMWIEDPISDTVFVVRQREKKEKGEKIAEETAKTDSAKQKSKAFGTWKELSKEAGEIEKRVYGEEEVAVRSQRGA